MEGGLERRVPVAEIRVGDLVKVLPGESFCVDGAVIAGETSVDESMLTGEAAPVFRSKGDTVLAGTLNRDGCLTIRASGVGETRVLASIAFCSATSVSGRTRR